MSLDLLHPPTTIMTTGSCLCGQVKFSLSGSPKVKALCHCTDCQKWCGAVASSNMIFGKDQLNITQGEDTLKSFGLTADSGKTNSREFCGNCGTSLFSRLDSSPDVVVVKTG